ncbi:MAG: hypothetical protein GF393_10035, partial [Armatimonadia bacterium]|nr:hypothetical protein [Armatimonadia bacterium]
MIPSRLLIGLLLAAVPLFALGAVMPVLPAVGVGVMLTLLALAMADGFLSRSRDDVEVTRRVQDALSLGAQNRVDLTVHNRTARALHLRVKDDPPAEFDTPERMREIVL